MYKRAFKEHFPGSHDVVRVTHLFNPIKVLVDRSIRRYRAANTHPGKRGKSNKTAGGRERGKRAI